MTNKKSGIDRRNFLKKGVYGFAGVAASSPLLKGEKGSGRKERKKEFIYRTLGKTGIKLPIVSMGVMNADNPNLVAAALDEGIVHLDTAWYYQRGRNEEMIGQVVKERPRDSYVLATKVWEPRDDRTGLFPKEATAETFVQKFETSLKRLQLDYVDILYLHNIARKESLLFEPYLNSLLKFKKEGKARFIGVSTHQNEPTVIKAAADSKVYDVLQTAYNFKQKHHHKIEEALEYATRAGMGVVGMKAIAASVKKSGNKIPGIAKTALKWALQNKNIHTNIPGFTTFDQMHTDLSVMEDLALTPQEKKDIELTKTYTGLYCQLCAECLPQCPKGLFIPALMRSYMYAYGYKNLQAAKEASDSVDLSNMPCHDCQSCAVKCAMGFDIKTRAIDIARIKDLREEFLT